MKALMKRLRTLQNQLQKKSDDGWATFDNRSEAWHETEAASERETELESIDASIESVFEAFSELENTFGVLEDE